MQTPQKTPQNAPRNAQEAPAQGEGAPQAQEPGKGGPERLPLLTWHARRKTKRDLLALAVTLRCWDAEQEPGSLTETELTAEEFDAAIAEAKAAHAAALKEAGRPAMLKVLVHDKLLTAVMVKRPGQQAADAMIKAISDEDLSEEETLALIRTAFTDAVLWPKMGSEAMANIMETQPIAFGHVFPSLLLATLGKDVSGAKKRG